MIQNVRYNVHTNIFTLMPMKTKTTLSISEARKNFFSIADEVQSPDVYYTLTERGRPKAVIVSADRFEALVNQQNIQAVRAISGQSIAEKGWLLREAPKRKYGDTFPKENEVFILKEAPKVLYVDRKVPGDLYQAKELAKAQLYVELIEKYKYPLYLVEVGRCVKVGGPESRRYTEADIIVSGSSSNMLLLFSVAAFSVYEEHEESALRELFGLAEALSYGAGLRTRLVYYTRSHDASGTKRKCMVVSYEDHPSYDAWEKSGRPSSKKIPTYGSFLVDDTL
jgi:prevent-host-death family protein